ncbi:MAG: cupin domain-containing protein [Rugosibacter sp.]|nr:cupin domain-containing protein [Rugosibacter sp.]
MSAHAWQVFDLADLRKKVEGTEPRFMEFLRSSQMSCAMYRLPAGALDMQAPHLEDEIYIVLDGLARLRMGDEEREVRPGMVLFVSATTEHSFFNIEEDLTLLAVFGPAASLESLR